MGREGRPLRPRPWDTCASGTRRAPLRRPLRPRVRPLVRGAGPPSPRPRRWRTCCRLRPAGGWYVPRSPSRVTSLMNSRCTACVLFCFCLYLIPLRFLVPRKRPLVLFFKRWQTSSSYFVGLNVDTFFFFGNCARARIPGQRVAKARVCRADSSVSRTSPGKYVVFRGVGDLYSSGHVKC